jgi:hemerythrin-like domain-containing protein
MPIPAPQTTPGVAPRHDLYGAVHKALRLWMAETLARLGRMDPGDAEEREATLEQAAALLAACHGHLSKENQYVHAALEARQPGASRATADEHAAHQDSIELLQAEIDALRRQPGPAGAERLYRHFAHFVAENLQHMHDEETRLNPLLWSLCSDDELQAVEQRIRASLSADDVAAVLRWMLPAMRPAERVAMLSAMQTQMPPQALAGVLAIVRHALGETDRSRLERALGLQAVEAMA